jgi:uncharacterized protein
VKEESQETLEIGLNRIVRFLLEPQNYIESATRVEALETRQSWVFLTDHHAFKLKKPIHGRQYDYRWVEGRAQACRRELRLNRRLAPTVYLDVLPITSGPNGLEFNGEGQAVEWLIKMRRLHSDTSLAHLVSGAVTSHQLTQLGNRLASFYADSSPVSMSRQRYLQRFEESVEWSRSELLKSGPNATLDRVVYGLGWFLREHRVALGLRAERVVEAHGDLRPEHIYFENGTPLIIDCLDFDRDLRLMDPADELCFLWLGCARLANAAAGRRVFRVYESCFKDRVGSALCNFYRCHVALLWARLASKRSRENHARYQHWQSVAEDYLRWASRFVPGTRATDP